MKKKKEEVDIRIRAKHFSWKEFIITFAVMVCLSAGQALVLGAYVDYQPIPLEFAFGMVGYWAIVAAVFTLVTHYQIHQKFDKPVRRLSKAAKQVAEGDFSVWLDPINKSKKQDYMDVMFQDFNTMVEELSSIEALKNDFISNVSHELKTPLSVIQSYAMALQRDNMTPKEQKEYTSTILAASKKLTALVTNILKLNKLEHQEIKPAAEPFDLCRQLCECALSFENLWEQKAITFEAEIEDRAVVCADESMLELVWNNLLSNALKFTASGGTITLRQTSDTDTITVSISDTGCGMREEILRHIFDKFYQGDTSHSQEGNGLGLALVRKVVELTGATMDVTSKLGMGTTFTIYLKVAP